MTAGESGMRYFIFCLNGHKRKLSLSVQYCGKPIIRQMHKGCMIFCIQHFLYKYFLMKIWFIWERKSATKTTRGRNMQADEKTSKIYVLKISAAPSAI